MLFNALAFDRLEALRRLANRLFRRPTSRFREIIGYHLSLSFVRIPLAALVMMTPRRVARLSEASQKPQGTP